MSFNRRLKTFVPTLGGGETEVALLWERMVPDFKVVSLCADMFNPSGTAEEEGDKEPLELESEKPLAGLVLSLWTASAHGTVQLASLGV